MEKITTKIAIEVWNIKATKDGYFSFKYSLTQDDKVIVSKYNSDYSGQTAKQFEKVLKEGYAFQCVLANELDS